MEGSGRSRVNSGAGRSSISDLFGRDPSAAQAGGSRCGDLFSTQGSYGDFQKEAFPAQASSHTQEPACRESTNREATGTRKNSSQECRTGNNSQRGHGDSRSLQGSSQNQNHWQGDTQTCFLSSSLYYGGRDVCVDTLPTKSDSFLGAKKDNQEDDTNTSNPTSASRGNWWQGSLYY